MSTPTICVDFDGTVVEHVYPEVGREVPGAVEVLQRLVDNGVRIILWTIRHDRELKDAVDWFSDRGIPLFGVNKNPEQDWTTSPKSYANHYIDVAAIGCPLHFPFRGRPFVNWTEVEWQLGGLGYFADVVKVPGCKEPTRLPVGPRPHASALWEIIFDNKLPEERPSDPDYLSDDYTEEHFNAEATHCPNYITFMQRVAEYRARRDREAGIAPIPKRTLEQRVVALEELLKEQSGGLRVARGGGQQRPGRPGRGMQHL